MATITLPSTPGKTDESFSIRRLDFSVQMMNGGSVNYTQPHYWWEYSFALPPMTQSEALVWLSRLNQLTSFENMFQASPPGFSGTTTGYSGAGPKVKGAGQTGASLACDGVTINSSIAVEGGYISFNGEMHQLSADADSDGSENVTFSLCENMRSSPADNADVEIFAPVANFRLYESSHTHTVDSLVNYGLTIRAIEFYDP